MNELKRKAFHHLALVWMAIYAFTPRMACLVIIGLLTLFVGAVEFIRLRRPEINAYLLNRFGGIHRESEVMAPSAIFWTLLGVWITMVGLTNPKIVLTAMGFLVFGDAAAALVGKKWGKRPWRHNPEKTLEGSAGFVAASTLWGCFFLKPWVVLPTAVIIAWAESRKMPLNDNFWIPVLSGAVLCVINLLIGR